MSTACLAGCESVGRRATLAAAGPKCHGAASGGRTGVPRLGYDLHNSTSSRADTAALPHA